MFRRHHVIAFLPMPRKHLLFCFLFYYAPYTAAGGRRLFIKQFHLWLNIKNILNNSITVLFFELLEGYLHNYFFITLSVSRRNTQLMLDYPSPNSGYKCVMCKDSHSLEKLPFFFFLQPLKVEWSKMQLPLTSWEVGPLWGASSPWWFKLVLSWVPWNQILGFA